MHLGEPANKKTKLWIGGIAAALALLFLIFFWRELGDVLRLFGGAFLVLLGFPFEAGGEDPLSSFNIIFFNCFAGFGLVFLLWLVLISRQAILPVSNLQETIRTAWHLILYIRRKHGWAIHIKDGELVASEEELNRFGHGVIVVDFNSAVVLEERDAPPGLSRLITKAETNLLYAMSLSDPPESPRVCGPGIVFTRRGERIRGVVDLRKQFRLQPKVHCYTRDGIELYANVNAIFTIGQDPEPDALQVTYVGEPVQENLRVVTLAPATGGGGSYLRVTGISDELDSEDAREIHHYARVVQHTGSYQPYGALPTHPSVPVFDRDRVFSAVFAQSRNSKEEVLPWSELPTRVAASLYREILATVNYDELYDIKGNGKFPLPQFKRRLMLAMRNNGILAYRLIFHNSGEQLAQGSVYETSNLIVSEVRQLTNPKLLRDRGIKIITSGFGDLIPTSPLVFKQRLDHWRAKWEQEMDITMSRREMQAMRVRSRAMAETQQDLWYSLSQVFSLNEHSEEALALYIMQSLESAAADPKTRDLLPANTLDFMRHIHNLLLSPPSNPSQLPQNGNGNGNGSIPIRREGPTRG